MYTVYNAHILFSRWSTNIKRWACTTFFRFAPTLCVPFPALRSAQRQYASPRHRCSTVLDKRLPPWFDKVKKKGWKVGAESDTLKSAEKLIFIAILPLYKMVNDFLRQIFVLMWLEFVPHFFARLSYEFVHSRHSALPNFFAIRQWCGVVEKGCSDLI